jgi:hypothetical protein
MNIHVLLKKILAKKNHPHSDMESEDGIQCQHWQIVTRSNIDDIPWRGKLVYNIIAYFSIIIDTLTLATFHAHFFGGAILKRNNHSINKEKTQKNYLFIYLSSDATCKKK